MKLAIDVQYDDNQAVVAGVLFSQWRDSAPVRNIIQHVQGIAPYEPGAFYKRELPCILALLENVNEPLDCIIIDGFVTLGAEQKDGLGMHLYKALDEKIPVVGVAKKAFLDTPKICEILRGKSIKPLFISAAGTSLESAKLSIVNMCGENRIPILLKLADRLCRDGMRRDNDNLSSV